MAACVNQAPELYGAAICDVGVLDMLRFQRSVRPPLPSSSADDSNSDSRSDGPGRATTATQTSQLNSTTSSSTVHYTTFPARASSYRPSCFSLGTTTTECRPCTRSSTPRNFSTSFRTTRTRSSCASTPRRATALARRVELLPIRTALTPSAEHAGKDPRGDGEVRICEPVHGPHLGRLERGYCVKRMRSTTNRAVPRVPRGPKARGWMESFSKYLSLSLRLSCVRLVVHIAYHKHICPASLSSSNSPLPSPKRTHSRKCEELPSDQAEQQIQR